MSGMAHCQVQPAGGDHIGSLMQRLQIHAGISIDSPRRLIESHVQQRMSLLGVDYMDDYLSLIDSGIDARAEWLALLDLLTVKATRFFRQPEAFECVADHLDKLLSRHAAHEELCFWSAGCATGQELYSLAMVVDQIVRAGNAPVQWQGIGTDISFQAIHEAKNARFSSSSLHSMPQKYRHEYLDFSGKDQFEVVDHIKSRTSFFHSNLLHVNSAPLAEFDIVFCQNVLIYFDRGKQGWIIDQLASRLKPGGLLILGAGEDVQWLNSSMHRLSWPGVCAYSKIGG